MPVIEILLPLFLCVAVGFVTTRRAFLCERFIKDISRFVLYISLPAVIFSSVTQLDLQQAVNANFILVYALSGLLCMLLAVLVSRRFLKLGWLDSYINGLGSGMPNSAFVGFPIILAIFDGGMAQAFLLVVLVENLLFIPLSLVLLESATGQPVSYTQRLATIVTRLRKNPIIVAIIVAVTVNLLGIPVPQAVQGSVSMFAQTSIALALFAIGGLLAQSTRLAQVSRLSVVAIIKLVMFPLFAFGLLQLFPVESDLAIALLIFSASPMLSIYPILGGLYQRHTFCTNTLVTTTVASGVSLSVVVALIS